MVIYEYLFTIYSIQNSKEPDSDFVFVQGLKNQIKNTSFHTRQKDKKILGSLCSIYI